MATIIGTGNPERLIGTNFEDSIEGNGGRDFLLGRAGADFLFGGTDDDRLRGQDGNDTLHGGSGADLLRGDAGMDLLVDGAGRDRLVGGADADIFEIGLDGEVDRILDYEAGVDAIRLVGVGSDEVSIRTKKPGLVEIIHAGEKLLVRDKAGTLTAEDISLLPSLVGDAVETDEGMPVEIDVLENDFGVGLQLESLDLSGTQGSVTITEGGTVLYDPEGLNPPASGSIVDQFIYRAIDETGLVEEAEVEVTVVGVAMPPVLVDLSTRTDEDDPDTVFLLSNGLIESGADAFTRFELDTTTEFSILGPSVVTFTAPDNIDSLAQGEERVFSTEYRAINSDGVTREAELSVTVVGENDDPEAFNTSREVSRPSDVFIWTGRATATDIDGDELTFSGTGVNSDGTFSRTIVGTPGIEVEFTIVFRVSDPFGGEDFGTVTLLYTDTSDPLF